MLGNSIASRWLVACVVLLGLCGLPVPGAGAERPGAVQASGLAGLAAGPAVVNADGADGAGPPARRRAPVSLAGGRSASRCRRSASGSHWLGVLEITGQVLRVPPFFEHFGKRLIKSPKLSFVDSGLAAHLLGIDGEAALRRSTFLGPLFEGFIAAEVLKWPLGRGRRRELFYFRDEQGLEVDCVVPTGPGRLLFLEVKVAATVMPAMAEPLERLG